MQKESTTSEEGDYEFSCAFSLDGTDDERLRGGVSVGAIYNDTGCPRSDRMVIIGSSYFEAGTYTMPDLVLHEPGQSIVTNEPENVVFDLSWDPVLETPTGQVSELWYELSIGDESIPHYTTPFDLASDPISIDRRLFFGEPPQSLTHSMQRMAHVRDGDRDYVSLAVSHCSPLDTAPVASLARGANCARVSRGQGQLPSDPIPCSLTDDSWELATILTSNQAILLDLGQVMSIEAIALIFIVSNETVTLETSIDGNSFMQIDDSASQYPPARSFYEFPSRDARYIRITHNDHDIILSEIGVF